MITTWSSVSPFAVAQWILLITVLSWLLFLVRDPYTKGLLGRHWKVLSVAVLAVVIWRIPIHGTFFHGLEYEDAYVYSVAGRQSLDLQLREPHNLGSPYLVSVCGVGSLESCYLTQTSSGHYIGFPAIIRLAIRCVGYKSAISNYVSLFANCIAVIMIFLISQLMTDDLAASSAACLVFASTPVFAIYGVGSYAEPTSNACLSASLFCYLRYQYVTHDSRTLELMNWCAITLTLVLAVLIKRENIILAIGLPLISVGLIALCGSAGVDRNKLRWAFLACAIALAFSAVELDLIRTVHSEMGEYGGFPFNFANANALVPIFFESFISIKWYSITVCFVLWGAVNACRQKNLALFPVILFVGYVLLYTTHVRSYYQLHGGSTGAEQALRLSMNCMSLWSLLAGFGIASIKSSGKLFRRRMKVAIPMICLYAGITYLATANLQQKAQSAEFNSRINPALVASRLANDFGLSPTYIVTFEPLVIQMFGPTSVNVLSVRAITSRLLTRLTDEDPSATFLFLKQVSYENDLTRERYAQQLRCVETLQRETLYSDSKFSLVRLAVPLDEKSHCEPGSPYLAR